jgi:hypothetical protein
MAAFASCVSAAMPIASSTQRGATIAAEFGSIAVAALTLKSDASRTDPRDTTFCIACTLADDIRLRLRREFRLVVLRYCCPSTIASQFPFGFGEDILKFCAEDL